MSQLKVNAIRHTGASSDAVTLASDGSCTVKATNNLSNRNLAHNGAMQVSQRGNGPFTSTSSEVGIDRYTMAENGSFNFDKTATREAITNGPDGFQYALKMTPDSVVTPTGNMNGVIKHVLEGQDVQGIGYGTSSCKKLTVSFYAKSASQNNNHIYSLQLFHYNSSDNARYWIKPFTVTSSWQRFSFTFPADTTGLVRNDNARGLKVVWGLAHGSNDLVSESTAWVQDNSHRGITGQSNFMDNTSNEFWMTGVQIETGDVTTEFEHLPYGVELAKCQRYFCKTYNQGVNPGTSTDSGSVWSRNYSSGNKTTNATHFPFPVTMRLTPSVITAYSVVGTAGNCSTGANNPQDSNTDVAFNACKIVSQQGWGGLTTGNISTGHWVGGHFTVSAEL